MKIAEFENKISAITHVMMTQAIKDMSQDKNMNMNPSINF